MLNYINIAKVERSNAYIGNYNRSIRHEFGPLLSKKNNTIILWTLFLSFIINEEDYFRNKLLEKINNDEKEKLKSDDVIDFNKENILKDDIENYNTGKKNNIIRKKNTKKSYISNNNFINYNNYIKWFDYKDYSCRYDVFILLYKYLFYTFIDMNNIKNLNFHKIFKYYFIVNNIDYITGVWKVLDKLTETEKRI